MFKKLIWFISGLFLGLLLGAATFAGIALAAEAVWTSEQEPERLRRAMPGNVVADELKN